MKYYCQKGVTICQKTQLENSTRGGVTNNLSSTKTSFKPLIASSLALALSVSVGIAGEALTKTSATPTISYDNNLDTPQVDTPVNPNNWRWGEASVDSGSFFQLQDTASSNDPIKNLTIKFDDVKGSSNPTQDISASTDKTLTITGDGNIKTTDVVFKLSNKDTGKGIILGNSVADKGTLTFDFLASEGASKSSNWNGNDNTKKRKIILDLSDTTTVDSKAISLIGNIELKAGMGIRNANNTDNPRPNHQSTTNTNVFEATFGGDVIGNVTISPSDIKDNAYLDPSGNPYTGDKRAGYRDIESTFNFVHGSLKGNIFSKTGINTFNFKSSGSSIMGSITADNGYPGSGWGVGSENEFIGGINKINFEQSGSIIGDITASNVGQNFITFKNGGEIDGVILSGPKTSSVNGQQSNANHNNYIIFEGSGNAIIGKNTKKDLKLDNGEVGARHYSHNIILVKSSGANSLKFGNISAIGDWGNEGNPSAKNFNLLDFEQKTNLTFSTMSSKFAFNVVGKGLVSDKQKEGYSITLSSVDPVYYNDKLFKIISANQSGTSYKTDGVAMGDNFFAEFIKTEHSASGTFVFGENNTSNAFSTSQNGRNYINVKGDITVKGNLYNSAPPGQNFTGHNNLLILGGTSIKIGESGNKISIQVDNSQRRGYTRYSNNTILLEANNNTLNISKLGIVGDFVGVSPSKTFNILSFNNGNTVSDIDSATATSGVNFIGKNLITHSGYDADLFDNSNTDTPALKNTASTTFENEKYQAKGSFTFNTITSDDGGGNFFNVESLIVNRSISANDGRGNVLIMKNGNFQGSIIANGGSTATNTIKANSITARITSISSSGGYASSNNNNNIIANSGTISIDTISASSSRANKKTGGNTITLKNGMLTIGSVSVSGSVKNTISFGGTGAVNGNITQANEGQNIFNLTAGNTTLTLNGKSGGTTHQITTLTSTGAGNKLILNNVAIGATNAMNTTIDNTLNTPNLDIEFKGASSQAINLTLKGANNSIKSIALGANSTGNKLTLTNGKTTISDKVIAGDKTGITFELGNSTELALNNGVDSRVASETKGATTLTLASSANSEISGTLSGGEASITSLDFGGNTHSQTLRVKNTTATFGTITANNASGSNLVLDASSNAVNVVANKIDGDNLAVKFGAQQTEKTLKIGGVKTGTTLTINAVTFENGSTLNTLDLSESSVTGITFTNSISVGDNQGFTLRAKGQGGNGTTLTFTGGFTTETNGTSTISLTEGNTTLEATANGINVTNLDIVGNGDAKVTFNSDTTIGTLTAQASGNNDLVIGKASATTSLSIGTTNSALNSVELTGTDATLTINGGKQSIQTLKTSATTKNDLVFTNNNLTIGEISNTGSQKINIELNNSTLSLGGKTNTISSLKNIGSTTIDLSSPVTTTTRAGVSAPSRKTLTIGDGNSNTPNPAFSGNLNLVVYADTTTADKIVVNGNGSKGEITISAQGDLYEILAITRDDNIQVAQISNGNKDSVTVKGGLSEIDGVVVDLVVEEDKDSSGVGTGSYYLGKTEDKGADLSIQEVASSVLTVNYDIYLANFNSINKRMGELRNNPNSQGVWVRVFGGNMSNDFGSGSKTDYVTAQGGYDYALTVGENAKNYVGVAIAYGKSWTKANDGIGLGRATLSNVDSQMVEVGVYNSYVADSGWYNDTILKFDYIMSDFTLQAGSVTADNSTNNFAMILSDEFGYRYEFGVSEKGSWYIDPQAEVAFGYFNQSDFNQALNKSGRTVLEASQDSILTLRGRAGASLGKKFVASSKGFASLYVGAFYEYDYINGGNATTTVTGISNPLDSIESNGRAIINVGSNIGLNENARLYIDVEKSFGDKQRTFMQFNLGARYSF